MCEEMRQAIKNGNTFNYKKPLGRNADIDRRAYTFCTLERLCEGLRRRELFITPSIRWSNPHAKLLQGSYWESARPQVCRALNLQPTPAAELSK